MEMIRCDWAKSAIEIEYHDNEWGKPLHDEQKLFEMLILEGMQAGLSWITILNKRENMRSAFDQFDPQIIARYDERKLNALLENAGIIRNRRKLKSLVSNAQAYLAVKEELGSFDHYIWSFTGGEQIVNHWADFSQVPAKSEVSDQMSKALKKRGFSFVGSTICYAYMQSIGMVNDHLITCKEYDNCQARKQISS